MRIAKPYLLALLAFIVLSVYYPAIFAPFCSIDDEHMVNWLFNLDAINVADTIIPHGTGYYYRPLLSFIYLLDKYVWDLQPSFMHLMNVVLHLMNTLLVYLIADRLTVAKKIESPFLPFSAALLFALHPINTESVLWISGRTDLLSCLFILWSFLTLLAAQQRESKTLISAAAFLFFVSTMAKDTAVFWYPGVMLYMYCTHIRRGSGLRTGFPYVAFSCVPLAYFMIRRMAFSRSDTGISTAIQAVSGASFNGFINLRIILKTLGFYLKKIIWPFPLNFSIVAVSNWYIIFGVVVILLSCYLLYRRTVINSLYLMAICLVLPALLVPLGKMAWTPIAERYLYMSVSFFSIGISLYVCQSHWLMVKKPLFMTALALGYAGIGYACYDRAVVWQDNHTLFQDCVNKSPGFAPARNELAVALLRTGQTEQANKILLSNSVPNEDKFSIVTDLNRAKVLASNKNLQAAINLLKSKNYDSSKPLYKEYLEMMLKLNRMQESSEVNKVKKVAIKKENLNYIMKLHDFTGDPIYYYQLGQMSLGDGNRSEARRYFMLAATNAPHNAFYREAAGRLAEKLR